MEGIENQALSQNLGLDPKKLLPLTPIVRGEAKPTNHGRGTTPADKTFHPNDTPTPEEVYERRHFQVSPVPKIVARI